MRLIELPQEGGRVKVIERRMFVSCHICNARIECPSGRDEWAWLKCGDVLDFFKAHRAHGSDRTVGAEVAITERE